MEKGALKKKKAANSKRCLLSGYGEYEMGPLKNTYCELEQRCFKCFFRLKIKRSKKNGLRF